MKDIKVAAISMLLDPCLVDMAASPLFEDVWPEIEIIFIGLNMITHGNLRGAVPLETEMLKCSDIIKEFCLLNSTDAISFNMFDQDRLSATTSLLREYHAHS
jgi:hypothetical protein